MLEERLAWLTNRSFASRIRTSAGIMSPADKWTISPTTRSSMGISVFSCPMRVTVQVVVIIASSFSAAFPLRDSCTKRRVPEINTIVKMITTVKKSKSSDTLPKSEKYGNRNQNRHKPDHDPGNGIGSFLKSIFIFRIRFGKSTV